ncbi:Gfo/Idh/MocA family oxidoreductase [Candidatus Poribacteria bacterium]|nr:Gfo/Idh/MocA family oxidoreductase [Candidatus Poribacteria bacterium]
MRKVKLGFLGCGRMGQGVHLPIFSSLELCEIVALAELRERLRELVGRRYGIKRLYKSHEELAEDPEIEAVAAIVPESLSPDIAVKLLEAGKHVYIEKPMATCSSEAMRMADAARSNGRILMVAYPLRFDAGVQKAKEIIEELCETGEFGEILSVRSWCVGGDWEAGHFNYETIITTDEPYPEVETKLPDFLPEDMVGTYLFFSNCYCHNINLIRFLFGDGLEVAYFELSKPVYHLMLDAGNFNIYLEFGRKRPNWWDESVTVLFEGGWLKVETPPRTLKNVPASVKLYRSDKGELTEYKVPWSWSFRREAEHFLRCVLEGNEPLSSGEDSVKDIELAESAFKRYIGGANR